MIVLQYILAQVIIFWKKKLVNTVSVVQKKFKSFFKFDIRFLNCYNDCDKTYIGQTTKKIIIPVNQARIDGGSGSSRLNLSGVHKNGVDAVEIRVDHEGRTTAQVNVLLPPIRHVVGGPPRFEDEIALEFYGDAVFKVCRQFLHALVVFVVEKRTNATQVLNRRKKKMFVEIISILCEKK